MAETKVNEKTESELSHNVDVHGVSVASGTGINVVGNIVTSEHETGEKVASENGSITNVPGNENMSGDTFVVGDVTGGANVGANDTLTGDNMAGESIFHNSSTTSALCKNVLDTKFIAIDRLVKASSECDCEGVRRLLLSGIDVNAVSDRNGHTTLSAASAQGHTNVVQLLLELSGTDATGLLDINKPGALQRTALLWAAEGGNVTTLQILLNHGAYVDAVGDDHATALTLASGTGDVECVKTLLIEGKSDINKLGFYEKTALQWAAELGELTTLQLLLYYGADVDAVGGNETTALTLASENGHIECVKELIVKGEADINKPGHLHRIASHWAAEQGNLELLQYALDHSAEVDAEAIEDGNHATALTLASSYGHAKCVEELVKNRHANINKLGHFNKTALQWAAEKGHLATLHVLIACNAETDADRSNGLTALTLASANGNAECVEALITEGKADVSKPGRNRRTALHWAAEKGELAVLKTLLGHDAEVDAVGDDKVTALTLACEHGHAECVKTLINQGKANVNRPGRLNFTALLWAAKTGHLSTLRVLLKNGVEVDIEGNFQVTALTMASTFGHTECVEMLLTLGRADINKPGRYNRSALHWAAVNGHLTTLQLLLNCDIGDVDSVDVNQFTALTLASEHGHTQCVQMLVSQGGAEINKPGYCNKTALHWAAEMGSLLILQFLLEYGASVDAVGDDRVTALSLATASGHTECMKKLITLGKADINKPGINGLSAVESAVGIRDWDIVYTLLAFGARCSSNIIDKLLPHIQDDKDKMYTILCYACRYGSQDAVIKVIEAYPDLIEKTSSEGITPIEIASSNEQWLTVSELIQHGAKSSFDTARELLHAACRLDLTDVVEVIDNTHPGLIKVDDGSLRIAFNHQHYDIACKLIEFGAKWPKNMDTSSDTETLLEHACTQGLSGCIGNIHAMSAFKSYQLLQNGDYVNSALKHSHMSVVEKLFDLKFSVATCSNDLAHLALCFACRTGHDYVVRDIICKVKNDLNKRDENGNLPLEQAISHNHWSICTCLLTHNADLSLCRNISNTDMSKLPYVGFAQGEPSTMTSIREMKADVCVRESEKSSLLLNVALYSQSWRNADVLIAFGADVRLCHDEQQAVHAMLFGACEHGIHTLIDTMITQCSADPNTRSPSGKLPLEIAAEHERWQVANLLAMKNANIYICNEECKERLLLGGCEHGMETLVEVLMNTNVDPNCTDDTGNSALQLAVRNRHLEVALMVFLKQKDKIISQYLIEVNAHNLICPKRYSYEMSQKNRGRALIINNEHFDAPQSPRVGTYYDGINLELLFKSLGFDTYVHPDLTTSDMLRVLREERKLDQHKQSQCFILAILSHGLDGAVYGTDNDHIDLEVIKGIFDGNNCPALRNKPKLFFIQACRGKESTKGFEIMHRDSIYEDGHAVPNTCEYSDKEKVHEKENILVAHSTVPMYSANRLLDGSGSVFIRTLIKVFRIYAHQYHVQDLLTMVRSEMKIPLSEGTIQISSDQTTLSKFLYLNPGYHIQ